MQVNSVALTAGYSSILNLQTLDTNGPIAFILSVSETTTDTFNLYGTLDAATTDNTNAYLIGVFGGGTANLPQDIAAQAKTWPFLLIQRTGGSTAGSLFVAGNPSTSPGVVAAAAPVVVGSYSTALDLSTLNAETIRIGSSRQMTSADSFEVYLSNDSALSSSTGAYYAGRIYGGGGANVNNTVVASGFSFAVLRRASGSTTGSVLAAGVSPTSGGGGGGTLNLDTLAVGNTAANGPIGALSAAASVDVYNSFLLTQTTAGVTATLPAPTDTTAGKTAFVMNASTATQSISMYGETIGVGALQVFEWTSAAWVGGKNLTQGGNAFGSALTMGTTDNQTLNLIANNTTGYSDTGIVNTIGRTTGASTVTIQAGTGPVAIATNATDHATNVGSVTGASATGIHAGTGGIGIGVDLVDHTVTIGSTIGVSNTTIRAGTSGVIIQPSATGPLTAKSGTTAAATFDSETTGPVNVGTSNNPKVLTLGNTNAGSEAHLFAGTGGIEVSTAAASGGVINIVADGTVTIDTLGTTAINIGSVNPFARSVFVGNTADPGNVLIQSGSGGILLDDSGGAGSISATAGSGGFGVSCAGAGIATIRSGTSGTATFDSGTTGPVNIGAGASAKSVTVGSTTGAASVAVRAGSGGMTLINNGTTYTWPMSAPTINGQGLFCTTAGVLSWGGAVNVGATKSTSQTITDGAGQTPITGWTEVTDTAAAFDPPSGTFTVPTTGWYDISVQIEWAATAANLGATFEIAIVVNGSSVANNKFVNPVAALAQIRVTAVTRSIQLTAAQSVTFRAQLSGAGTDVATTASAPNNGLSITKIG